jgi:hypothetical protein
MNSDNQARLGVAALVYLMVIAVVFGVGLISILMTPALAQHAFFWIPAIIVTSLVLSAPLAWSIAPSMMMRFNPARRILLGAGFAGVPASNLEAPGSVAMYHLDGTGRSVASSPLFSR